MSQCDVLRLRMPELLTETFAAGEREAAHQHIEVCGACAIEWQQLRETWMALGEVADVPVPAALRARFLDTADLLDSHRRVVPFPLRRMPSWIGKAAAMVLVVAGAFYAGEWRGSSRGGAAIPATLAAESGTPYSLVESRVVPASLLNPEIEGRPAIENVQFVAGQDGDGEVAVSFDVKSHVTITGKPNDKALVRLLSYVLQSESHPTISRSRTMEWVKTTYGDQGLADPEIVAALANVLKNDTHEGVRIKAVETLQTIPAALAPEARAALIEALQNDPNPAVRIKAVDALARLARVGGQVDPAAVEMLRRKASQDDENTYVRVKAAEVLGQIDL